MPVAKTFDELVAKIDAFREAVLADELREFEDIMVAHGASEEVIASELERGRKEFEQNWPGIRDAIARHGWGLAMEAMEGRLKQTSEPLEVDTRLH
jgi:hypothetical protein